MLTEFTSAAPGINWARSLTGKPRSVPQLSTDENSWQEYMVCSAQLEGATLWIKQLGSHPQQYAVPASITDAFITRG